MLNLLLALFWFVIGVMLLVLYYTTPNPQWPVQVNGYPLGWVPLLLCVWNAIRWYAVRADRLRRQSQADMQASHRYPRRGTNRSATRTRPSTSPTSRRPAAATSSRRRTGRATMARCPMKPRKISRKALRSGCERIEDRDGVDPRYDRPDHGDGPPKVKNRKALQLCGQVAETLNLVLSGEGGDDVLRNLIVESVTPAPNAMRLLVTLVPGPGAPPVDPADVLARLHEAHGRLRSEVVAAIHRRRAPELTFRMRIA
jgi:hypothetical protein